MLSKLFEKRTYSGFFCLLKNRFSRIQNFHPNELQRTLNWTRVRLHKYFLALVLFDYKKTKFFLIFPLSCENLETTVPLYIQMFKLLCPFTYECLNYCDHVSDGAVTGADTGWLTPSEPTLTIGLDIFGPIWDRLLEELDNRNVIETLRRTAYEMELCVFLMLLK